MTADRPLLVRCDANVVIGTGHVMRCLALAQAWQDTGGRAIFAMAGSTPAIEERLRGENFEVAKIAAPVGSAGDAEEAVQLAHARGAPWIVVDGYEFGTEYQATLKRHGLRILFIDDNGHAGGYCADLVLNQNAHAQAESYRSRDRHTRLLLGPHYALLRREFVLARGFRREIPAIGRRVLVTMGGSDPHNVTATVIEALALTEVTGLEALVVVGGSNPHLESLRTDTAASAKTIGLLSNVGNLAEWMIWADVAVSAAGSTCWEMCFLGLPSILIDFAPNQTALAEKLHHLGAAVHVGNVANAAPKTIGAGLQNLILSQERRSSMSRTAAGLVDGRGSERVVAAIRRHGLRLREVEMNDSSLLWEWANDPDVRQSSFSPNAIGWDEHRKWFADKLVDARSRMFVATDEDSAPVGQIRLDRTGPGDADIDLSVAKDWRGRGYGVRLIELAVMEAFKDARLLRLHAYVLPSNQASAKSFEAANFQLAESAPIRGHLALHYILEKAPR